MSIVKTFFFSAVILTALSFLCPKAYAGETVFITQVQVTGGTGHTSDDFIELFNPSNTPFNLKGYRLVKRTATASTDTTIKSWTSDAFILPRSFYLWANSNFTSIVATPDVSTSGTIADDNGVALRLGAENTGTIIDSIAWGKASNGFNHLLTTNPTANQAIIRTNISEPNSAFSIGPSNPRNSSINDGSVTGGVSDGKNSGSGLPSDQPALTAPVLSPPDPSILLKSNLVKIIAVLPDPTGEDAGREVVVLKNTDTMPVNLESWLLGDKSDAGPRSSAYVLPSWILMPEQIYSVTIPEGAFALNNSGDAVNLYFSDKSLADKVEIPKTVEGKWYEKVDSTWVWSENPIEKIVNGFSQGFDPHDIILTELMPNPEQADEGREWVEVYNSGNLFVNLKGFSLDIRRNAPNKPGKTALVLPTRVLPPKAYAQFTISEDNFTLHNESDAIRLFSPKGEFLQEVVFSNAPEGLSYALGDNDKWQFTLPTPEKANVFFSKNPGLRISEILPLPESSESEFIELENTGPEILALAYFQILIGKKSKFLPDVPIEPGKQLVLWEADLPARLNNSGQTISLVGPLGQTIDSVTYEKVRKGYAYARTGDTGFIWTESPTPGAPNQLVLAEKTNSLDSEEVLVSKPPSKITLKKASLSVRKALDESSIKFAKNTLPNPKEQITELPNEPEETGKVLGVTHENLDSAGQADTKSRRSAVLWKQYGMILSAVVAVVLLIKFVVWKRN